MIQFAAIVDFEALWQTAVAAIVGGLGIVFCFSIAIWGSTRASDFLNEDRRLAAAGGVAVAAIGLLASAGLVAAGIVAMLS